MESNSFDIPEIDMRGFKVVSSELFTSYHKMYGITCTIWDMGITFSKASVNALNGCERIRIEIHPSKKQLLIVPVTEKDKDGILWLKGVKEPVPKRIQCKTFTNMLYETWQLDKSYAFRALGRIVSNDKKVMILYDFNNHEKWKNKEKTIEQVK